MLIDTHCHIDQFPSPEKVARDCEDNLLRVVAVTNLPSHFTIAADRLRGHKFVSAALGMHPLFAAKGIRELGAFKRLAIKANFIGEVGLDFSRLGVPSKAIQERVFDEILGAIGDRPRFVTLHSKGAELAVLEALRRHKIRSTIFHWFSGSGAALDNVLADGHFVSINPAMLSSLSGRRVIDQAPRERVLTESDGPFAKIQGTVCGPSTVGLVYDALAVRWNVSRDEAILCVESNFSTIVGSVRAAGEN